jgi:hypothetical protein
MELSATRAWRLRDGRKMNGMEHNSMATLYTIINVHKQYMGKCGVKDV